MSERVDRIGVFASSLCAAHCAMSALMPAAFGALGLGALLGHEAEWGFTVVAILFAAAAAAVGWSRHRSKLVIGLLALGVAGLLASRGLEMSSEHHGHEDEAHETSTHGSGHEPEAGHDAHLMGTGVGVTAGLFLMFGHVLNIRASRRRRDECCA